MIGTTTSAARAVLMLGALTFDCGATQSPTLRNPGFEEVVNGMPVEWTAGGAADAVAGTSDTSNSGDRAMRIMTPDGGIGPLLGDGTAGWFSEQDDDEGTPWGYRDGAAWLGARDLVKVESPVRLPAAPRPVAVLIGPGTGSAGEAVAVAFDGLPNVRSFGHKTSGQATSTTVCPLADGAVLVVASTEFVSRTGRRFVGGVLPDEPTEGPTDSPNSEDRTLAAALDWIRSQQPCDDNTPRAADADR